MFQSIGWGEILVLIVVGLFVLGPERLPEAAAWLGRSVRKARDFASGAHQQLRDEMGPEFDEFRKPIEDLQSLRGMNPRQAVTRHLFDGDSDPLGLNSISDSVNGGINHQGPDSVRNREPLKPGEKPPVDPDAT